MLSGPKLLRAEFLNAGRFLWFWLLVQTFKESVRKKWYGKFSMGYTPPSYFFIDLFYGMFKTPPLWSGVPIWLPPSPQWSGDTWWQYSQKIVHIRGALSPYLYYWGAYKIIYEPVKMHFKPNILKSSMLESFRPQKCPKTLKLILGP